MLPVIKRLQKSNLSSEYFIYIFAICVIVLLTAVRIINDFFIYTDKVITYILILKCRSKVKYVEE